LARGALVNRFGIKSFTSSYLYVLWTDQVCIDQSNGKEKTYQAAFMRHIYQRSERVLVCISTASSKPGLLRVYNFKHAEAALNRVDEEDQASPESAVSLSQNISRPEKQDEGLQNVPMFAKRLNKPIQTNRATIF
jgi:Heterokaryon incompatibility protein (HET)